MNEFIEKHKIKLGFLILFVLAIIIGVIVFVTQKKACQSSNCSGHGTCDTKNGKCTCSGGYSGDNCDMKECQSSNCSGNGTCDTKNGKCTCTGGFIGALCNEAPDNIIEYMTSNNNPTNLLASSSSDGGGLAFKAFDGNMDTIWSSADKMYVDSTGEYVGNVSTKLLDNQSIKGEWLQLQVINFPIKVSAYDYKTSGSSRGMNTFYLLFGNDGINWNIADYRTKVSTEGNEVKRFTLSEPKVGKYWRFVIVKVGNEYATSYRTMVEVATISFIR